MLFCRLDQLCYYSPYSDPILDSGTLSKVSLRHFHQAPWMGSVGLWRQQIGQLVILIVENKLSQISRKIDLTLTPSLYLKILLILQA